MVSWNRILVPTDFSETSQAAVRQGVELARERGAGLILLYVGDAVSQVATEFPIGLDASIADAERERLLRVISPADQVAVHPEFVMCAGAPAEEIVRFTHDPRTSGFAMVEGDGAEVLELEIRASSSLLGRPFRDRARLEAAVPGRCIP